MSLSFFNLFLKTEKSYFTGLAWSYSFSRLYQLEEHYGILEVLDSILYAKRNYKRRRTVDCKSTQLHVLFVPLHDFNIVEY